MRLHQATKYQTGRLAGCPRELKWVRRLLEARKSRRDGRAKTDQGERAIQMPTRVDSSSWMIEDIDDDEEGDDGGHISLSDSSSLDER